MSKKLMLIPILGLLLMGVPAAMAGTVYVEGKGTYSQTVEFGDGKKRVSDSVTLTGVWDFGSDWGYGSGPEIDNYVKLYDGAIYSERAISPRGALCGEGYSYQEDEAENPGLYLKTFVQYGETSIHDTAEIKVRGYDFTFDVDTTGSYTSTKNLVILDSYHNTADTGTATTEYMDWARFQVTDTTDSVYVVGGIIEYEETVPNFYLAYSGCLYLEQMFTQGSDSSITSQHTIGGEGFAVDDWARVTAFYGYDTAGDLDYPLDWYAEVTEDAHVTDIFYASFADDNAHFWLEYGEPENSIILDAYSNVGDFSAYGFAEDTPELTPWIFAGPDLHRSDGTSIDWTVFLDMDT